MLVAPLHRRYIVILGSELILIFYCELAPSWRGLKDFVMDGHLGRKFREYFVMDGLQGVGLKDFVMDGHLGRKFVSTW